MKKFFVVALAMLATAAVNAQEYGFEKGNFGVEIEFNPFTTNFNTFRMDGLKVRYALSDKDIVRAKLGLSFGSSTTRVNMVVPEAKNFATTAAYDAAKEIYDNTKDDFTKNKQGSFSLDLGYERHLFQKGRIDLYAGAEVGFEKAWAGSKTEATNNVGGAWKTDETKVKGTSMIGTTAYNSSFDFNLGIFTGMDFYIVKGLYAGAELGLNFGTSTLGNIKTENTVWTSATAKTETEIETDRKNTSFNGRININPALRLGWTF